LLPQPPPPIQPAPCSRPPARITSPRHLAPLLRVPMLPLPNPQGAAPPIRPPRRLPPIQDPPSPPLTQHTPLNISRPVSAGTRPDAPPPPQTTTTPRRGDRMRTPSVLAM
jgi:hypothetical protein